MTPPARRTTLPKRDESWTFASATVAKTPDGICSFTIRWRSTARNESPLNTKKCWVSMSGDKVFDLVRTVSNAKQNLVKSRSTDLQQQIFQKTRAAIARRSGGPHRIPNEGAFPVRRPGSGTEFLKFSHPIAALTRCWWPGGLSKLLCHWRVQA
jgi:hypothetical protein